jgi:RHS repeat-associated protein
MTVLGQPAVSYTYDNADRLTGITQGSSAVSIALDADSRRTSLTLPNGVVGTYSYDTGSQLTGISYSFGQMSLGTLSYTYDAGGRRTQVSGTAARTGLPQAVTTASYNTANQLISWAGSTLTYDANGNLTADGTNNYTWNARNDLVGISGGVTASFQYDAVGRRSRKTIAGGTTDFLYDGDNSVQELSAGTPTANLITGLPIDEFFTRTDAVGTRALLIDGLGSTLALSDSAGTLQTQYTYEPFGRTTFTGQVSSSSIQFTGRENDGTGLFYYRARYFSASLGRFVSEDPIEFGGGQTNLYAYVGNDPVSFSDPLGQSGFWASAKGIGASGARAVAAANHVWDSGCNVANSMQGRKARWAMQVFLRCGGPGMAMGFGLGMAFSGPGHDIDALRRAGQLADRGGLTKAGRALAKHGGREGSVFPQPRGNPAAINELARTVLDDILSNMGRTSPNRFGGLDYWGGAKGAGVRFDKIGRFIGFLEP